MDDSGQGSGDPLRPVEFFKRRPATVIDTGPVKRAEKPSKDYGLGVLCVTVAIIVASVGGNLEAPFDVILYVVAFFLFLGALMYFLRRYYVDMSRWYKDSEMRCDLTGNEGYCFKTHCTNCVFAAEYLKKINENSKKED